MGEKQNEEKERVVTIKKLCEILGCSRTTYYALYRIRLTPIATPTSEILYKEEDVLTLKKQLEEAKTDKPYQIIK